MRTPKPPQAAYRLEPTGGYAVYADDNRLFETDEVAIMVNLRGHRLMFHGRPAELQKKYGQFAKTAARGPVEMKAAFDDYVLLSGHFDLGLLNRALTTGDARSLYVACEMQAARDTSTLLARMAQLSA